MPRKRTTPDNPAPVSGPGALSARTDGGPGSQTQPLREIPGQPYGEGQALLEQQRAAPLPASGSPSSPVAGAAGPPRAVPNPFGPTERPNEPITAGMRLGPGRTPQATFLEPDPDTMLKAMYRVYPHPRIAQLMKGGRNMPSPVQPNGDQVDGLDRRTMAADAARAAQRPQRFSFPPTRPRE